MLKKIKKIGKIFLGIILAGFVVFEFYYYGIIDFRESRNLTSGEIKFLSEVYSSNINYSEVKIYPGKFLFTPLQDEDTAMSPNGNVYFSQKHFREDFSKQNIYDQAWLVHEIMHVYQYEQRGQSFAWEGAGLILKAWVSDYNPYSYKIDYAKIYSDYNIEQQGDIASDYFIFLKGEKTFTREETAWYEKILNK